MTIHIVQYIDSHVFGPINAHLLYGLGIFFGTPSCCALGLRVLGLVVCHYVHAKWEGVVEHPDLNSIGLYSVATRATPSLPRLHRLLMFSTRGSTSTFHLDLHSY
jgi:hypothetical protein